MTEPGHAPIPLDACALEHADARAVADDLLHSDLAAREGHAARTLAKSRELTVVVTVIRAGGEIRQHAAPCPVAIIPLFGRPEFHRRGESGTVAVGPGEILFIGTKEPHRVTASEDSAFQIVVGARVDRFP